MFHRHSNLTQDPTRALGTFSLTGLDWVIILAVAFTICPVLELAKWIERRS